MKIEISLTPIVMFALVLIMGIQHFSLSLRKFFSNGLVCWVLASILALSSGQTRAGTSDPGIGQAIATILSPILFVTVPIFKGFEFLFGSDKQAREDAEKKAETVLATHPSIPVSGLYVVSTPLRNGLYGMLVERKLPLVEVDITGSKWLFDLAKNQQGLVARAQGNKYVRLSLGSIDSPECFLWMSESDNWVKGPPVKPGTCLRVSFHNTLISDTRLRANVQRVNKRELRWELTRIADNGILIEIPFWASQVEGYPINFDVRYRHNGDSSAFSDLMKKLVPSIPNLNADGTSYVLDWVRPAKIQVLPFSEYTKTTAAIRLSNEQRGAVEEKLTWELGYRRAQQRQQPTVINNLLVILPKSNQIYITHDAFVKLFATDCCVLSLQQQHNLNIGMVITGKRFTGKEFWHINIKPDSHPKEVAWCTNSPERCYFATDSFKVSDSELVISGRYSSGSPHGEKYEWVVPLSSLPPW